MDMNVFTMVVLIVIVTTAAGVYNNYLKLQKRRVEDTASDEVYAELDALRARVEVLEKIVTDEKYLLNKELNDLERSA